MCSVGNRQLIYTQNVTPMIDVVGYSWPLHNDFVASFIVM